MMCVVFVWMTHTRDTTLATPRKSLHLNKFYISRLLFMFHNVFVSFLSASNMFGRDYTEKWRQATHWNEGEKAAAH
jgi:hypothetical protein